MSYVLLIVLGTVLFFTPYFRGLFFDSDFYWVSLVVMACFLAWAVYAYIKKKTVTGIYGVIFLIPVMYVLAFLTAESTSYNFDNLFRWLAYACFFVMIVEMRKDIKVAKWIPNVFQVTGIAIALFSFLGYLGWIEYKDIVLSDRLSGPFQYPNTFAAVMGTYWLYSLMMTIRNSADLKEKILYSVSLVLFGTTFLLSFSRGALIVLPVAWFIGLILLGSKAQWMLILYTVLSVLLSVLTMVLADGNAWLALLLLILCSVVPAAVTFWLSKRGAEESLKVKFLEKHGRWLTPVAILVIGALLVLDLLNQGLVYRVLPDSLQKQVSSINLETGSVLGRMSFYEDALCISQHYPLLGAGGEGWRILYAQYQTEPYLSNEIHNGYLEVLLNIGIIGSAVFLIVFALLMIAMFKGRARQDSTNGKVAITGMISGAIMLFIHAFLDFNFSFGSYWFILLWLLAMAVPVEGKLFNLKLKPGSDQVSKDVALGCKIAIVLLVLVGVFFNARVYAASTKAKINNRMTIHEVVDRFESAFGLNPYNVTYGMNLASLYAQWYANTQDESMKQKAIDIINKVIKLEPNNSRVLYSAGEIYLRWMDWDQAIAYMDQAISKEPFEVQFYNGTIPLKQQLGVRYADDAEKSRAYLESAVADYETYEEWYNTFKDTYLPDKRNIELDRQTYLSAARAYAKLGQTDRALSVLEPYHPVLDEGIMDAESKQVLVDSFEIMSLGEVLSQYSDRTIIVSVRGTAARRLTADTISMLQTMGSSIDQLAENGSYIAVISGGKLIQEEINNNGDASLTNQTANSKLKELIGTHEVAIYSAGKDYGDKSTILIDGVDYSHNHRGMNIGVFDQEMALIGTIYFDTHVSEVRVTL